MNRQASDRSKLYFKHPETAWAVERDGILVIRQDLRKCTLLPYPEAALWDMVSRQLPIRRIISLIAAMTQEDTGSITVWIDRTVEAWHREGWVVLKEKDGQYIDHI
jgi:hypothetical protein